MFGIGQLSHANGTLSVVKLVQEVLLHLFTVVGGLGFTINVLSKAIAFDVQTCYFIFSLS